MIDGKCSKRYLRNLITETITGNDGYLFNHWQSIAYGGQSVVVNWKLGTNFGKPYPVTLDKIIFNSGIHFKSGLSEISAVEKKKIKLEIKNVKIANKYFDEKNFTVYIPKYLLIS